MPRRETSRDIDEAAARWAARLDAAPLSAGEEAALEAWLAADPRRAGAFAKARAVSLHVARAKALGPDFDPARFAQGRSVSFSRRAMLGVGAAGALAASIAIAARVALHTQARRYRTRLGEVRVVSLDDGSVVTLNTQSEIAVRFDERSRAIDLISGEALFDVAKDRARPFIVEAGDMRVRALGTSFSVRRTANAPAEVLVREGIVEVSRGADAEAPVRLRANARAIAGRDQPMRSVPVAEAEVGRQLAWREGRLAFEGETLREAAAQFARYSETRIVFEDPTIGDETVAGLFVSTDPVGFCRAVATSFGLEAEVREGEVRLRH